VNGSGLAFQRLAEEAASGRWRPVYLLAGPDAFQQRAVVDGLRSALVPEGLREAVETDIDGGAAQPADVVGVALTPSLAGRRLVVVHDAPWFGAPRGQGGEGGEDAQAEDGAGGDGRRGRPDPLAPLFAYLDNPPPDTVVVFRSQAPADGRRRIVKRLGQVGAVLAAVPPPPDELPPWCAARARAVHGVRLAPGVAAALCARVPPSLDLLDQELAKLATYVGPGGSVGMAEVEALVPPSREESVFALMDAVGEGRGPQAFALLRRMLGQGEEPLGLLALLARQVRLLVQAGDVLAAGGGPERLAAAAGLPPYVARRMLAQARGFGEADLTAALAAVWEAEWAVKSGRLDEASALTLAVARLLGGRGEGARAAEEAG
jgi:DNA polymerase-3 subunit delta